jgi:hypothetical protein
MPGKIISGGDERDERIAFGIEKIIYDLEKMRKEEGLIKTNYLPLEKKTEISLHKKPPK